MYIYVHRFDLFAVNFFSFRNRLTRLFGIAFWYGIRKLLHLLAFVEWHLWHLLLLGLEICSISELSDAYPSVNVTKFNCKSEPQIRAALRLVAQSDSCAEEKISPVVSRVGAGTEVKRDSWSPELVIDTQEILNHSARDDFDIW